MHVKHRGTTLAGQTGCDVRAFEVPGRCLPTLGRREFLAQTGPSDRFSIHSCSGPPPTHAVVWGAMIASGQTFRERIAA